jgi:dihydrofolate reductase
MASTLNGIIARSNGDEDFLSHDNWKEFSKLAKKHGCFIVGRKTYQAVKKWKDYNFDSINAKRIIVSKNSKLKLNENYILASSPKNAINKATKLGMKSVLLTGGGKLNSSFLRNNLVDEILLNINPVLLGKGIKIFSEDQFEKNLKLVAVKKLSSSIVQLHYKLQR